MRFLKKIWIEIKFAALQTLNAIALVILIITLSPFIVASLVTLLVMSLISSVSHSLSVGAYMYNNDLEDEFKMYK